MKRLNDKVEEKGEVSELKKSRIMDGVGEVSKALERNDGDGDGDGETFVPQNGVDNHVDSFEDTVPYYFDEDLSLGRLEEINIWDFDIDFDDNVSDYFNEDLSHGPPETNNKWDFDINFDSIFGNGEDHNGLVGDLNVPVLGRGGRRKEKGIVINENKKAVFMDISSDDSDDEVKVLGYSVGPGAKGKQTGAGPSYNRTGNMPCVLGTSNNNFIGESSSMGGARRTSDEVKVLGYNVGSEAKGDQIEAGPAYNGMENLALVLGTSNNNNFVGESSSMGGAGRIPVVDLTERASVFDPWLSLNIDHSNGARRWQPPPVVVLDEVGGWHPPPPPQPLPPPPPPPPPAPVRVDPVRFNAENEAWVQNRRAFLRRLAEQRRKETALRFARVTDPAESSTETKPVDQKTKPVASKPLEQFGVSPGPFLEALTRVRERTLKIKPEQLIEWKPALDNPGRSITAPLVPSLLDLSLKALAENFDGIASLELVPDLLRRKLVDLLCDTGKMNAKAISLLVDGCPTEIRIKNCSWLTEKQFQESFGNCQTENLKVLQLDLSGQCMFDFFFKDKSARSSNRFPNLAIVSLRGACRLSDCGLKAFVMSAPALRSINLGHCTLLTCDAINFIGDFLGPNLRELYINDCQKINAMLILPGIKKFTSLEALSVSGVPNVTDQFISEIVIVCGHSIKELDLADCMDLTEWSIKHIANSCKGLLSLNISNLKLTDLAMEYLGNGCRSIEKLNVSRGGFSDEAVAAFLEASGDSLVELLMSNVTKVGPNTAFSLAKHSRKLLYLDISFCRRINNEALGLIVDCCSKLKLLKVFGCRQISSIFLSGHSNPTVQIIGLELRPIMNHLTLLEPGEVFLRYSPLPVCPKN